MLGNNQAILSKNQTILGKNQTILGRNKKALNVCMDWSKIFEKFNQTCTY